jgi:hypothetical protein
MFATEVVFLNKCCHARIQTRKLKEKKYSKVHEMEPGKQALSQAVKSPKENVRFFFGLSFNVVQMRISPVQTVNIWYARARNHLLRELSVSTAPIRERMV